MESILNKKILIAAILLFFLSAGVILAVRFTGKSGRIPEIGVQEGGISKQGLIGQANLLLSTPKTDIQVGDIIEVTASAQLTDDTLKISGADFVILYEKSKLEVTDVVPNVKSVSPNAPFDVAPIVTYGGKYDDTFDFLRVAEAASKSGTLLAGGTVNLAKIRFRAKEAGGGVIKYPDEDKYIEIAGIGTYVSPTPLPTSILTPIKTKTPTPSSTNFTPTPTKTMTPTPTAIKSPTPMITNTPTPANTKTPTPTFTKTPTPPAPTIVFCSQKPYGDANCDNLINDTDYDIWKCSFTATCPKTYSGYNADFNSDRVIDLKDFEIWRANREVIEDEVEEDIVDDAENAIIEPDARDIIEKR